MANKISQLKPESFRWLLDELFDGVYFVDRDRRITYWNRAAEQITGYSGDEILGCQCQNNILCHVDHTGRCLCTKGCPLAATIDDGNPRQAEVFLHHKEGHRVPVHVRISPVRDCEGEIIGAIEVFNDNTAKQAATDMLAKLQRLAFVDPLTNVANRRFVEMSLRSKLAERQRFGWPVGLMMLDLDHFKQINDRYGHDVGDQVLRVTARTLAANCRPFDVLGRWGGEEFIGIFPQTDACELFDLAQRLRQLVSQSHFKNADIPVRVTISIGATLVRDDEEPTELIRRADELLYRSKAEGRDRVTMEPAPMRIAGAA
jgi:diguanylate cyclase (GGDEF)-like protein/PAS domain S-box-containing protein